MKRFISGLACVLTGALACAQPPGAPGEGRRHQAEQVEPVGPAQVAPRGTSVEGLPQHDATSPEPKILRDNPSSPEPTSAEPGAKLRNLREGKLQTDSPVLGTKDTPNTPANTPLGVPRVGGGRGPRGLLNTQGATNPVVTPGVDAGQPLKADQTPLGRGRAFGGTETPALGATPESRPTTLPSGTSLPPGLTGTPGGLGESGTPGAGLRNRMNGTPPANGARPTPRLSGTTNLTGTPSSTSTPGSAATPTATATPVATMPPTVSSTPVATPVATATPQLTATPAQTATPSITATPLVTATPTATATPLVTATPGPTGATSGVGAGATATPSATVASGSPTPFVPTTGTPPGGAGAHVGKEARRQMKANATPGKFAGTISASPTPGSTPVATPATATPTPANWTPPSTWAPYPGWQPPSGWHPPSGWNPPGGWNPPAGWNPPSDWYPRLFHWGWQYVSGRGWVVPPNWVPPPDFVVPPGWYYLPQQTYTTYGFYNPAAVVVAPGVARRDLITEINTTQAYVPPEDVPVTIEELPPPPPRPLPEETPQITNVQTKTEVVETLTRERKPGDRYAGPVLVTQTIHFDYDSYAINPESFPALDAIGDALVNPPLDKAIINVEGHTDSDGSDEYNQTLSERRAWSVKSYLVQKFGIDPNRLVIVGYGERAPIASNDNDEGKALNRRVEFENVTDLYQAAQAPESAAPAAAAPAQQ